MWISIVAHVNTQYHAHAIELLRTSDRPVAETSTWQHPKLTRYRHLCLRRDSNEQSQQVSGLTPTPETARPPESAPTLMREWRFPAFLNVTCISGLVTHYVNLRFPGRWISRGRPQNWSQWSPDLIPFHVRVCGCINGGHMRSLFFTLLTPVHASVPATLITHSLAKRQESEPKPKTCFWSRKIRFCFECGICKMMYNVELACLVKVHIFVVFTLF